jgi:biotin carboxylase
MNKQRILILGAGLMQGPAIRAAKALEYEAVVVDGNPNAPLASEADRFAPIDLKDKDGLLAFARTLPRLAGCLTVGTDFSASVAWVTERLGLPGHGYEAALNATDKGRMRGCFDRAGVPSPRFVILEGSKGDCSPLPFPLVVKPVDNMGARGCCRVDNDAELREAVATALPFSRSGRVIIEEYMDGPEFSIDALVFDGKIVPCGIADRHIFFPPYFIEMGHTMPTSAPDAVKNAVWDCFCAGARALGLTHGAAKGDMKMTSRGPMVGEIAARLSGGYMSGWTYPLSSGVDVVKAAVLLAVGKRPTDADLRPKRDWTAAERAFIVEEEGVVKSIDGVNEARNTPFVTDVLPRVKAGDHVAPPVNNVTKCGNVIACAPSREEAVKAAEDAAKSIKIMLEWNGEKRACIPA